MMGGPRVTKNTPQINDIVIVHCQDLASYPHWMSRKYADEMVPSHVSVLGYLIFQDDKRLNISAARTEDKDSPETCTGFWLIPLGCVDRIEVLNVVPELKGE